MPSNSLYEVQHHFARKLYEAFVRTGIKCRLLEGDDRYLIPAQSPPDFTIGFNGGLQVEAGVFLADLIRVPHVACLIDPPFRFLSLTSSPYTIIACDDRFSCDMVRAFEFPNVVFMPHAVEADLKLPYPEQKRPYEITMLATFIDCENKRRSWKSMFSDEIYHAMEKALEDTLGDDTTSFLVAVPRALHPLLWTKKGTLAINPETYYKIFSEIELYIKGRDRIDLIESLPDLPIDLFGSSVDTIGWADYFKNRPNIRVHSPVPYEQVLEIMKQSKIVLNSCIKNKAGAHERIFSAAACGAVCVTNENEYLKEQFSNGTEMIFYSRNKFECLQPIVQSLLENETQRLTIAAQGRQAVMTNHTWDNRVAHLLKTIPPMIEYIRS